MTLIREKSEGNKKLFYETEKRKKYEKKIPKFKIAEK